MTVTRRLFLCIEGLDGVGKTSVAESIAQRLGYYYFGSPGGSFNKVRSFIDDGNLDNLSRYFFYRAATQNDSKLISQILKHTGVVCDRYIYSTIAYHAAVDPDILLIHNDLGLILPDKVILLQADADVRTKRIHERGDKQISYLTDEEQARAELIFKAFSFESIDTSNNSLVQTVDKIVSALDGLL